LKRLCIHEKTQRADALLFLGEIDQVEVDGEGRGDGARRVGGEGGDLGPEACRGRRVGGAASLGEGADALLEVEEGGRLLLPQHLAEEVAEEVDRRRQVHGGKATRRPAERQDAGAPGRPAPAAYSRPLTALSSTGCTNV